MRVRNSVLFAVALAAVAACSSYEPPPEAVQQQDWCDRLVAQPDEFLRVHAPTPAAVPEEEAPLVVVVTHSGRSDQRTKITTNRGVLDLTLPRAPGCHLGGIYSFGLPVAAGTQKVTVEAEPHTASVDVLVPENATRWVVVQTGDELPPTISLHDEPPGFG